MSAILSLPVRPRGACTTFTQPKRGGTFCRDCGRTELTHPLYALVYCSSCGAEFFGGNHGYSMCDEHAHRRPL